MRINKPFADAVAQTAGTEMNANWPKEDLS